MPNPVVYPGNSLSIDAIGYDVPSGGALTIPLNLDFSLNASYVVDLAASNNTYSVLSIQSAYLDNSSNPGYLTLTCSITGMSVTVPPFSQTWQPLLVAQNTKFIFSNSIYNQGAIPPVKAFLSNIPIPNGSSNAQIVQSYVFGSGGRQSALLAADKIVNVDVTAGVNLIPETLGFGYFVTSIQVQPKAGSYVTTPSAGVVLSFYDFTAGLGSPVWKPSFWLGNAAATNQYPMLQTPQNWQYRQNQVNAGFFVGLSGDALAAGAFTVTVNYGTLVQFFGN